MRYEEREIDLSHVTALDFYVSYWSEGLIARSSKGQRLIGHTFVSFAFDNAAPLSISIEARPVVGRGFEPIPSMFKQFELIYVVGEERDLVSLRAVHRREAVYLYRLNTSPDDVRRLLMVYLTRINELADRPEFCNLFTNSCTINIIRYANAAGRRGRFDIRHLLNGLIDSYLYRSGRIIRRCRSTNCSGARRSTRPHRRRAAFRSRNFRDGSAHPFRRSFTDLGWVARL